MLVVGVLAVAPSASAQFETTLQRLDRESNERQWASVHAELHRQIEAFNVEIAAARARFWATYPDKPGAKEAQKQFFDLLHDKDVFYVTSSLTNRMSTGGDPGDALDGGIRSTARPEFDDLIEAGHIGMDYGDMLKMTQSAVSAINRHPDKYRVYRLERDWWEFDQMHRIPAQWDTPERYPIYLYVRYYQIPLEAAEANVARMTELLGKEVVVAAARKVMDAPKTDKGNLVVTATPPIKRGPGGSELDDYLVPEPPDVIGSLPNPLVAFNRLVAQDDDRRYLLTLLTNQSWTSSGTIDLVNQWTFARTAYGGLVAAFGERELLEAARKVRTAPKAYVDGTVMKPNAIGAARNAPFGAFAEIITHNNPRGYLRAAVAAQSALDTPAAVDAAYRKLVADGGEETYLVAASRRINHLPNLAFSGELRSIQALLGAGPEPAKEPEEMVDFPEYVKWKRFRAGARVTYVERKWMASRPRPGRYNSDDPTRLLAYPPAAINSYLLKSINEQKADLWYTESLADAYGKMHPARDYEVSNPAKYLRSVAERNARNAPATNNGPTPTSTLVWDAKRTDDPVESGEEIVEVQGQRIATHRESAKYTAPDFNNESGVTLVVTVWTSDAVPTGLVRRTEDKRVQHIPGQFEPARYIVETYLESFEGLTLPPVTGSGPVMTAYTPPDISRENTAARAAGEPNPRAPAVVPPTRKTPVSATPPRESGSPPSSVAPKELAAPAAPARSQPAVARPAPAIDTSKMSPEVARQFGISQKYSVAVARASRARSALLKWQQTHAGDSVPPDVAESRDAILTQMQAAAKAMATLDSAQVDQAVQTLDASSAAIEGFLGK